MTVKNLLLAFLLLLFAFFAFVGFLVSCNILIH